MCSLRLYQHLSIVNTAAQMRAQIKRTGSFVALILIHNREVLSYCLLEYNKRLFGFVLVDTSNMGAPWHEPVATGSQS